MEGELHGSALLKVVAGSVGQSAFVYITTYLSLTRSCQLFLFVSNRDRILSACPSLSLSLSVVGSRIQSPNFFNF